MGLMARIRLTLGRMGRMIRAVALMTRKLVCVTGMHLLRMRHKSQWGNKN